MTALRPSGGMRENTRLPNNSYTNEIITACQYPCMAVVQIPSLCDLGIVTAVKCLLQNLKALCCRNGQTKVRDSIMAKLPPHSINRIMYKSDPLISQIRQPPNISGYQVSNTPFIKTCQWGCGPSNINKRTHGRISTCKTCT